MDIPAFGAVERKPDPRDFPLGAVGSGAARPPVFLQDWSMLAVEHQHQIPACGAHAAAFLKDVQETIESGSPQRKSPRYIWDRVKQIDGYPLEAGTDMLSLFKTLKDRGACDLSLLSNDTLLSLRDYSDAYLITQAMDDNAKGALIGNYGFIHAPSMDEIKQVIYEHKAILMLIRVGQEFWSPSWKEADILPLRTPASVVGGHFVVGFAYDEKRIYFRNSWGDAWGRKGDGYFEENYLPFVVEIGTAFDLPKGRFSKDLSYGMANPDVFALQKFLIANGYGAYTATGFFGDKTMASVKAFQVRYSIPATGFVGPLTRGRLNQLY